MTARLNAHNVISIMLHQVYLVTNFLIISTTFVEVPEIEHATLWLVV